MFYENLKESCIKSNTNVTNLLKKLNLPTSNTGSWKKGMLPKGETLKLIAKELNVSTDYLLGLTEEQKENNFTLIKMEEKEMRKKVQSFNAKTKEEKFDAILKEWDVKNDIELAKMFSLETSYLEKVLLYESKDLKKEAQEIQEDLARYLDVRMPLHNYRIVPEDIEIKITPFSRFIMKKTNELDDAVIESIAQKLDLLPISILSWGSGERKPNKRCLDLLFAEFEPADYLMKEFSKLNEEYTSEIISKNKKAVNEQ